MRQHWRIILRARPRVRKAGQSSASEGRRLDSWKEIASFLGRGIRTVQRWEREEGLPVHRLPHAQRGSVFADANELTAWWERRQIRPEPAPQTPAAHRPANRVSSASRLRPLRRSGRRCRRTRAWWCTSRMRDRMARLPQLWLQQIGGAAVQLTSGLHDCAEPSFSADDTRVAFSAAGGSTRNVYEIPALGGLAARVEACGAKREVLAGWQVAGVYRARTARHSATRAGRRWRRAHAGARPRRHRVRQVV